MAKFGIFAERDYSNLEANDVWIFDNHTLDIISIAPPNGRPHRMSLTAIQDAKSGVIVGYNPCDEPCSESTLFAIHRAVSNDFGLCRYSYLDNGSEFCAGTVVERHESMNRRVKNREIPTDEEVMELLGLYIKNYNAGEYGGKEVYVRYNPYNLDSVRIYDKDTDKYLWIYPRADYLAVPFLAAESEDGKDKIALQDFRSFRNSGQ